MDFGLLPKTLEFIAALSLSLNISSTTPEVNLTSPNLISSQNLPVAEMQSLDVVKPNSDIEMVIEEPKAPEVATVEQPLFYTVVEPTPKPTPEVKDEETKVELVAEAKASEPSPSPSSTPTSTPSPSSTPVSSGSTTTDANGERLFQMVNEHRASKGLASFEKDSRLCDIATKRAPQVNSELSSGTLHKGFKDLNLPYWATENIAAYSTIEQNLKFWLSDYIHRIAIEGTHKYSCVACSGSSCSEIFTSFVSK